MLLRGLNPQRMGSFGRFSQILQFETQILVETGRFKILREVFSQNA